MLPSKTAMSPIWPFASVPMASPTAVFLAAFAVTIIQRSSSLKNLSKYVWFSESAQRSSRSMFIEPEGSQSVPSEMVTPMRAAIVTCAVLP